MKLADAPDVLTVDEAAAIARCGRNQMYQAVARGDVWSARIGKSIRIPKSALVAFLHLTEKAAGATTSPTAQGSNHVTATTDHRRAS